jgi:hypothetical protein
MLKVSVIISLVSLSFNAFAQIDNGQGEVFLNTYSGSGVSVGASYYSGYDVDQTLKFVGTGQLNMFGPDSAQIIAPYNIFVGGQLNSAGGSLLAQVGDKGRYNVLLSYKFNRFFVNGGLSNGLRVDGETLVKIGGGINIFTDTQRGGAYCYNNAGDFNSSLSIGVNLFKWANENNWKYNVYVSYMF